MKFTIFESLRTSSLIRIDEGISKTMSPMFMSCRATAPLPAPSKSINKSDILVSYMSNIEISHAKTNTYEEVKIYLQLQD